MPRQRTFARRPGPTLTAGFSVVGLSALSGGRRIVDTASTGGGESGNASPLRAADDSKFAIPTNDALQDLLDDYA